MITPTTVPSTTAHAIATALGMDGQRWITPDGVHLDDLAEAAGGGLDRHPEDGAVARWSFPDGSALTLHGPAWDVGFLGCWCWAGAPHDGHGEAGERYAATTARAERWGAPWCDRRAP